MTHLRFEESDLSLPTVIKMKQLVNIISTALLTTKVIHVVLYTFPRFDSISGRAFSIFKFCMICLTYINA